MQATRSHPPVSGASNPMEATPIAHFPPAMTLQGTSPLAGLVLPMGYKLVPEDPTDAKRAAFWARKKDKMKENKFDLSAMPKLSPNPSIAAWITYWRKCTTFCTTFEWHLICDMDNQFKALMHAAEDQGVKDLLKICIPQVIKHCKAAEAMLQDWGSQSSAASTGAYFIRRKEYLINYVEPLWMEDDNDSVCGSYAEGSVAMEPPVLPPISSFLQEGTDTATLIKSMVASWLKPAEPTKRRNQQLDLIWAANEALAPHLCKPTKTELQVWSSLHMGQGNVYHPDTPKTESPKEFLRRLMETFHLNNRYNKQFQSDSGRASPMEVFISGLPEYLSKVGKDKKLTLRTDAPEEHKLSAVAIAVDTHYTN